MKQLTHHIKQKGGALLLTLFMLIIFSVNASAVNSPWSAIEVIAPIGQILNAKPMLNIAEKSGLPAISVYQWYNHLVAYGKLLNIDQLQRSIKMAYPKCAVKIYQNPFYDFDRKQQCGNARSVKKWDNILLTADMVKDPKLQQEYLNYHATQFKKWPEVANGFCNADFQQLLVFKNGRQLMLVISIPKGASLDKLNPKTGENNPRVDDWNKLMKKYQEGIPGTKPGEVWVFLKQLNN
jgi:hypothetical protein